eukprot:COSAG02_NODE_1784_length_10941_cov_179.259823_2_plen_64_part_00
MVRIQKTQCSIAIAGRTEDKCEFSRAARGVQHTKSCFLELSSARITIYIRIILYIHVNLSVLT